MKFGSMCKLLVLILVIWGSSVNANGDYMSNPFGDTGAEQSIEDARYYDFYFPYNLTYREIGGYAIEYSSGGRYKALMISDQKSDNGLKLPTLDDKLNYRFNVQWTLSQMKKQNNFRDGKWLGNPILEDEDCGMLYVDVNGRKSYLISLPKAIFNNSVFEDENTDFKVKGTFIETGILFDIILKDGTVICCATIDGMGLGHTNNQSSFGGTNQDSIRFKYASMSPDSGVNPYQNLYYAASPNHSFEVCSNSSDYDRIYSVLGISDENPIVAVRVWNKTIQDSNFTSSMSGLCNRGSLELPNLENNPEYEVSESYQAGSYKEVKIYF